MPSCNVQVFNATNTTIAMATIAHSTTAVTLATDLTNIGNIQNLPGGGTSSATLTASQGSWGGDYWTCMIQFANDPTVYIIMNDAIPICECSVPDNGSCSFVISDGPGQYNIQINTYKGPDWNDPDGTCQEQLINALDADPSSELVKGVLDLFGEG